MAKFKSVKTHLVFCVSYDYDDIELNEHFHIVNYFVYFKDIARYLLDLDIECVALDNAFYRCRSNPRIKISQKTINDKLYVSLFNQNSL